MVYANYMILLVLSNRIGKLRNGFSIRIDTSVTIVRIDDGSHAQARTPPRVLLHQYVYSCIEPLG